LKENATLKRSCQRKKEILNKVLTDHYIIGVEEHIGVSLLRLAFKKNALCLVYIPTSDNNEPNSKNF
jgi:hypothetical protein